MVLNSFVLPDWGVVIASFNESTAQLGRRANHLLGQEMPGIVLAGHRMSALTSRFVQRHQHRLAQHRMQVVEAAPMFQQKPPQ